MRKIAQSSKLLVLIAGLVAAIAAPTAGRAQSADYPSQRISIVVGFAVGGFADTIGRWIATRLGERLGQTVVVQNMEGGGGIRPAASGTLLHGPGRRLFVVVRLFEQYA